MQEKGFKRVFSEMGVTNRELATVLGVSDGYLCNVLNGHKISLSIAKRLWIYVSKDLRTPQLAQEVCEMILKDKQVLEICSIDKFRAFAYFEFR